VAPAGALLYIFFEYSGFPLTASLERNVRLYRWFHFASSFYGWLPVFFLYFNQYVTLAQTMQLGAIYYFSVCLCEVPSGYLSDRTGRRFTLILSAISLAIAYSFFLAADSFALLAVGQFFLAMGIAMMSGTDTAFLYDSLLSLGRKTEYAVQEARAQKYGFAAASLTSLLGGGLGMYDLRLAYWLSMAGALWMVLIAIRFVEPKIDHKSATQSMFKTIGQCVGALANPVLGWLFAVMILMYCLEHITFEFYQPYIRLMGFDWFDGDNAALVSAVVISASMFGGTLGAAYSVRLYDRFGIKALLVMAFLFQLAILSGLSLILSGMMLSLVVFRNFPMAMISAPVNATIAPLVGSHLRATYLSIQSLSARLVLSGLLFVLSRTIDSSQSLDWINLSFVLREALVFGLVCTVLVVAIAPAQISKAEQKS